MHCLLLKINFITVYDLQVDCFSFNKLSCPEGITLKDVFEKHKLFES